MPYETLLVQPLEPHVLLVTMNRPGAMNAHNTRMGEEMRAFFRELDPTAQDTRAIVLTGAGERAFCVGADLKERQGMSDEAWRRQHVVFEEASEALWRCPVPVLAAVNGFALGGGCETALACDFIIAAENASFGQPEVLRGIIPGTGGTQRLPRRIGPARAKELLYTGRILTAAEALDWGLVNRVVPAQRLLPEATELALMIARSGPIAVRQVKKAVERGFNLSLETALAMELECYAACVGSEDRREGINAFNEKRPPVFKNR
ncbi:MAG TPA: enoyl-CoA hydratase-related protein [bacterium]|nr:enoyl-CoA hydratase-related protein [bacterium]